MLKQSSDRNRPSPAQNAGRPGPAFVLGRGAPLVQREEERQRLEDAQRRRQAPRVRFADGAALPMPAAGFGITPLPSDY